MAIGQEALLFLLFLIVPVWAYRAGFSSGYKKAKIEIYEEDRRRS